MHFLLRKIPIFGGNSSINDFLNISFVRAIHYLFNVYLIRRGTIQSAQAGMVQKTVLYYTSVCLLVAPASNP